MHIIISLSPMFFPLCERFYFPILPATYITGSESMQECHRRSWHPIYFFRPLLSRARSCFLWSKTAGLKGVTEGTMSTLGKAAPFLQALDLSYFRDLHNSSPDALVACMVLWHPHLFSINKTVTCSIRRNTGNLQWNRFGKTRQDIISYWYNRFVKNSFLCIYSRGLLHVALAQILEGVP